MNKILILLLLITINTQGQNFEGKLYYKAEFKLKMKGISKKDIIDHMKKSNEYYDTVVITLKDGNYEKVLNSIDEKRIVYKPKEKKIYTLNDYSDLVIVSDADKLQYAPIKIKDVTIKKNDSITKIFNRDCKSVVVNWDDLSKDIYYYDESFLSIDPIQMKDHLYDLQDRIYSITKSHPVKITKSINNLIGIELTLVKVLDEKINMNNFKIPDLEIVNDEYSKIIKETTGTTVMKKK